MWTGVVGLFLLFWAPCHCWKAGTSHVLTGQVEVTPGSETFFAVNVSTPSLDFYWKIQTQGKPISVYFMEEVVTLYACLQFHRFIGRNTNSTKQFNVTLGWALTTLLIHLQNPPGTLSSTCCCSLILLLTLSIRQLFYGIEPWTTIYFLLHTQSDTPVTATWKVSFSEELKDTISASTVYTMALTASIMGFVGLLFGSATLFFFFYKVPPDYVQPQRI